MNQRKKGIPIDSHIGYFKSDQLERVYTVHPKNRECFFLRMVLHEVRGPTSFNNLKTFDGQVCATYQEACFKRGLLESDQHWGDALTEASLSRLPGHLRHLFAMMLQMCEVSDPLGLYKKHKESLSEDDFCNYKRRHPEINDYNEAIFNEALFGGSGA